MKLKHLLPDPAPGMFRIMLQSSEDHLCKDFPKDILPLDLATLAIDGFILLQEEAKKKEGCN